MVGAGPLGEAAPRIFHRPPYVPQFELCFPSCASSPVINEHLEEVYPNPPMLPRDPYERARVRMLEDTTDQHIYAMIRGLTTSQFEYAPPYLIRKKADQVDHKLLEESRMKLHEQLQRHEQELKGRAWLGGEIFSLADAAVVSSFTMSLKVLGILPDPKYPKIGDWITRAMARPSYKQSAPKEPVKIKEG